ncbi:phage repressor protein C with HTH and peptisase S24 domain [Pseudomonas frederiksbergensis]|uniref:LexA family transcriptional regulator n=1 Tax=Pseudomonas frederiksbergensis TaxID=104087 RepID=UPI003D1F4A97
MLTGKELGAAIESARLAKGVSKKKLAEDFGVKPPSVQGWVNSGRIDKSKLMQLIDYFSDVAKPDHWGLSDQMSAYLGSASIEEPRSSYTANHDLRLPSIETWDDETPLDDDEVYVPFLQEVELAAGSGRFAIEESDSSRLRFFKKDLRHNNVQFSNAKCVVVSGNSMVPVLRDGATVGVNVGKNSLGDIVDGDMYAINHNGQLRVKQVYRLPIGIRLRSFNRDEHPDEDYTFQEIQDQHLAILGHVFWWAMYAR